MDDKNFDDKIASEWMSIIETDASRIREQDIYPMLNLWLTESLSNEVLEIGCGQGICSSALDLTNCRYVGVDPSPVLVQRAKVLYEKDNTEFVLGNAYALPFPESTFKAAFSVAVWHLLEEIGQASPELARVLKEGGSFLLISADPALYSVWTDRYQNKHFEGIRFEGSNSLPDGSSSTDILYLHPMGDIVDNLERVGLSVKNITRFRNQIAISGKKLSLPRIECSPI